MLYIDILGAAILEMGISKNLISFWRFPLDPFCELLWHNSTAQYFVDSCLIPFTFRL